MNQTKVNNGWILCPSKSFPGKFYYFNVLNGEAAWSLNEIESKTPKKGFIHTVTDKSHTYPEPSSPPVDENSNSNSSSIKKPMFTPLPQRTVYNTQAPTFGQATFQKYMYNAPMPNIYPQMWTPFQLPMFPQTMMAQNQMMPPNQMLPPNSMLPPNHMMPVLPTNQMLPPNSMLPSNDLMPQNSMFMTSTPDMKRKTFDRKPQNSNRDFIVQTCDMPLSKRFENYSKQTKPVTKPFFNKFYDNASNNRNDNVEMMSNDELFGSFENLNIVPQRPNSSVLKEPVFKRHRTQSESKNNVKIIKKSNSLESLLSDYSAVQKPTMSYTTIGHSKPVEHGSDTNKVNKADNGKVGESFEELDRNDLRFLLVAKRRKSLDLDDYQEHCDVSSKKVKTTATDQPRTAKKHVTFSLGVEGSDESLEEEEDQVTTDEPFEERPPVEVDDVISYVVSDIDTLLDELECIDDFVLSDENRRLVIYHALRVGVEAASRGDGGRAPVLAARRLARRVVAPPGHYVILPPESMPECSAEDNYTLYCCLTISNAGDDVILITNNPNLYDQAKSLNITCYNTQQIKDGAGVTKPEVKFNLTKIKISVNNKNKTSEKNPTTQFDSNPIHNKDQNSVKTFKRSIFDEPDPETTKKCLKDANTSPIGSEALANLTENTKTNQNNKFNFKNPDTEGMGIEKLFIKDKKSEMGKATENMRKDIEKANRFENVATTEFANKNNDTVTKDNYEIGSSQEDKKNQIMDTQEFTLDDCLNEYCIDNSEIRDMIKLRIEEWICVFTQIMEDALVNVLIKGSPISDKLSPPWVLYEATKKIEALYGSHTELRIVTQRFRELLWKDSNMKGKLKSSIKPNDFMKIVGCGVILIQILKKHHPHHQDLSEAESSLLSMLEQLSRPSEPQPLASPALRRCDVDDKQEDRRNFIKKPAEIVEYLKAHYPEWKEGQIPQNYEVNVKKNEPKILRTVGRNLNLLNIDHTKTISMKKPGKNTQDNIQSDIQKDIMKKSTIVNSVANDNGPKTTKLTTLEEHCNKKEPIAPPRKFDFGSFKIVRKVNNDIATKTNEMATPTDVDDLNVPKHGNTFNQETAGPKILRTFEKKMAKVNSKDDTDLWVPKNGNSKDKKTETKIVENVKSLESFEDKSNALDLDALDYSAIDDSAYDADEMNQDETKSIEDAVSFVYKIKDRKKIVINNDIVEHNDNALDNDINDYKEKANTNNDTFVNDEVLEDSNNKRAGNNDKFKKPSFNEDSALNDCSVIINDCNDKGNINDSGATTDSGFENDSVRLYGAVKHFLRVITGSMKDVHQFIGKSVVEFSDDKIQENRRRVLRQKAYDTHLSLARIIDKLKSIIVRESGTSSVMKEVLLCDQAASDKRMTRYKQVIMKCLEQAQLLQEANRALLELAADDAASISTVSADTHTRYFNIFE